MKIIFWIEPLANSPTNEPKYNFCTEKAAIESMKAFGKKDLNYIYKNDKEALCDFIMVHRAKILELDENTVKLFKIAEN